MKLISTIVLMTSLFSFSAIANEKSIDEKKAQTLSHLDMKIASLNDFKSCVDAAKEKGDIKKCRSTHKEKMKSMRGKHKKK